jgi:hypothetical protein
MNPLETIFIKTWNNLSNRAEKRLTGGLPLGKIVLDERVSDETYFLPTSVRTQHMAVGGATGSGKTRFLRSIAQHDIDSGRGFVLFDLHGDLYGPLVQYIAAKTPQDFGRIILVDPTRQDCVVGINPIEAHDESSRFRLVAEQTRSLCDNWNFRGARSEEILRASLFALSENGLTLLEMGPFLSNDDYRQALLKNVTNAEVREFFELRFNPLSEAMKATVREPVLNKFSELIADPHFRFILGQRRSTFSFDDVLAEGKIVLVNLNKGRLGIHAMTLGALIFGALKAAIFRRTSREPFTAFLDEVQNLASADVGLDTLFAEARKFSVGIVTANQVSEQLPQHLRAAIGAIGTRVYFRLSPDDAAHAAQALGGGRTMAERLRNLPPRHAIVKSGHYPPREIRTLDVEDTNASAADFLRRSMDIYAVSRSQTEADIMRRRPKPESLKEVISDWE